MKKERKQLTFALTILYAFIIFCTVLVTVLLSGVGLYLLVHFGIITEGRNPQDMARHLILYMGITCVIVGSLIALLTSKMPLKPLNRVMEKMKELKEGDFKARLHFGFPINKHPTIAALSDSFNTMASELENTEVLRSDFINNFSHEFKTPIVSITGFAKLLKKGNLTEEQKQEYLDVIEEESLRLSAMATNVLDLTKVENQTILTNVSRFNLSEQIRSCVLLLEKQWSKKEIDLSLEFDEFEIVANEELLKQVWINLLDNAIKYSPEYGSVMIKIVDAGATYKISIFNSGDEIPLDKQSKIFDKFYQADESHSSKGNGIGLAIVKRVTELHEGYVSVESKNEITTFTVEIPKG